MAGAKEQSKFVKEISLWTASDRIAKAKEVIHKLTDKIIDVIELASVCDHVVYGKDLPSQIPVSHAGHSYRISQDALFKQLVVQTIALWDKPDSDVVSIPVAMELIDDPAVVHEIQSDLYELHALSGFRNLNPSDDPEIEAAIQCHHKEMQKEFAASQAEKADLHLRVCIESVQEISNDIVFKSIENLRNHISHYLIQTRGEKRGPIPAMKYGEERELRERSIRIIETLYCWVNGVSFDIKGNCVDQAKRNAFELWASCEFNVSTSVSKLKALPQN